MYQTERCTRHLSILNLIAISVAACSQSPSDSEAQGVNEASPEATESAAITATEAQEQKNLATFDDLDFNVYSGQLS